MSLQQKLRPQVQQKLVLTPTLQQAIRLLQLTRLELQEEVSQELQTNPVLEESATVEEPAATLEAGVPADHAETDPLRATTTRSTWRSYFQDYLETNLKYRGTHVEGLRGGPRFERYLSAPESLSEHLEWQISLGKFTEREQEIARIIVGT